MNCNIVLNMVNHLNDDPITFSCYNPRPWELPVDSNNIFGLA